MTHYSFNAPNGFEIIIGDENQPIFKPRIKVKRWGNEVNFSVGIISPYTGHHTNLNNVIEWTDDDNISTRFYEIDDTNFEFEIELESKPISNTIDLSIQSKGLNFYFQPELTQQEIKDGHIRPENVVNSYAVYHKTKSNHKIGETNYQTGKAFHIFRPHVIDSIGTRTWCDMHINENSHILSITVPLDFIDNAVYPIIIDPTFGWGSQGGTGMSTEDKILMGRFQISEDGSGTSISTWLSVDAAAKNNKCNVYDDGGGAYDTSVSPFTNGETEEIEVGIGADQLITFDFNSSPSFISGTYYRLVVWSVAGTGINNAFYDSTVAADDFYANVIIYDGWPDPTALSRYASYRFSIYCTYSTIISGHPWFYRRNQ